MDSFQIFCDESWKEKTSATPLPYFVFHGVLLKDIHEQEILDAIADFREERGFPFEIKWDKAHKEFKEATKSQKRNRFEYYLESVFFKFIRERKLSFGVMYLEREEFRRVEREFCDERDCTTVEFLFMLYYQFLTHCFVKNQVKNSPVRICIDERSLIENGEEYSLERFRRILNQKHRSLNRWSSQIELDETWMTKVHNAVEAVDIANSKSNEFIQLADLVAGCFRYVMENKIPPPDDSEQPSFFDIPIKRELVTGQDYLVDFFYRSLRQVPDYQKIDLCADSRQYRFNIFPFRFVSAKKRRFRIRVR